MPIEKLNAMLNWRIQYEEAKQKRVEEEISKQKSTLLSKQKDKK